MLALLEQVRERTVLENPFLGEAKLRRLEADVSAEDATSGQKLRARRRHLIGVELLRLGREREAVARLGEAAEIVASLPPDERPPFTPRLHYDLGVAWLRLGETANCVALHTSASCILPIREEGRHTDEEGSRQALRWLRRARGAAEPGSALDLSARWLLNLAAMTVGEHPAGLEPDERIAFDVFAADVPFPRFREVAGEVGLAAFDLSGGAVADDFDGDGRLDVVTSTWDADGPLRYFRNAGERGFEERTREANLGGLFGGLNLVQADYDDDGRTDLLVLRGAWLAGASGRQPNSLLRNRGERGFVDVTFLAGLGERHFPTQTGAFADYDLDGDLDLYVGNESTAWHRHPSQLFRNEGDGTFVDVAPDAGVTNMGFAKGVVWGDYDEDHDPDLFVSNLAGANRLYRNEGDGSFSDVAPELGLERPIHSFPAWFFDYDQDGHLDLFVSSYDKGEPGGEYRLAGVVAGYLGLDDDAFEVETPRLYRGDGRGGFRDVSEAAGLARATLPMSGNFGDLDNDGYPEMFLGTGYPYYDGLLPNVMYWNLGGSRFLDVTRAGGFGHLQKGHGVVFADLDDDGDLDVYEQIGGAYPGDAFGNALWENPGFGRRWIEVRLVGTEENRSAIGARIRAEIEDGGQRRTVHRRVSSGGSFGANPLAQHLGLGSAERVESLVVSWPRSGRTQIFRELPVDVRVEIVEGEDEPRIVREEPFRLTAR